MLDDKGKGSPSEVSWTAELKDSTESISSESSSLAEPLELNAKETSRGASFAGGARFNPA